MSVSRAPVFLQESSQTTGSGILLLSFKLSGGGHPPSAATNSQKGTSFLLWGDVGEPRTSPPTQGVHFHISGESTQQMAQREM